MSIGSKTPLNLRKRESAVPVFAEQGQLAHDLDCRSPSRHRSKGRAELHSAAQSFCVASATNVVPLLRKHRRPRVMTCCATRSRRARRCRRRSRTASRRRHVLRGAAHGEAVRDDYPVISEVRSANPSLARTVGPAARPASLRTLFSNLNPRSVHDDHEWAIRRVGFRHVNDPHAEILNALCGAIAGMGLNERGSYPAD